MHAPAHARVVLRTIAAKGLSVDVSIDGSPVGAIAVERTSGWNEVSMALPDGLPPRFRLALRPKDGELFDAHVWIVERGPAEAGPGAGEGAGAAVRRRDARGAE